LPTPWIECDIAKLNLELPPVERYRVLSDRQVGHGRELLDGVTSQMPPGVLRLAETIDQRTGGKFRPEAEAIAARHGTSWQAILIANVSYDLLIMQLGCSTVMLPTPDGPVAARNMDWAPEALLARASILLQFQLEDELLFQSAGWPGSIGVVTGMSSQGYAIFLHAVAAPEGSDLSGYPMLLFLRTVLEQSDGFSDALKRVSSEPLVTGGLISVVGTKNEQRVVVERAPRRHALRWAKGDEPLMATNHYRMLDIPSEDLLAGTCSRFDRLKKMAGKQKQISDETLLGILADKEVRQEITAQHVIMRPALNEMRLFVPAALVE